MAPTDDDIAALRADGYVADVLQDLRRRLENGDDPTARAALTTLADMIGSLAQDAQVSR